MRELIIQPVEKTNWKDFEKLFSSKGAPGYCWCMAWRMTKEELKQNTSANRRKFIHQRVKSGVPIGLLAYQNHEPVGWCSVAPRDTYQRLDGVETLNSVWSIACFYVKKEVRQTGLVSELIKHAKKYAKQNGAKFLEAYPVTPDSSSYRFMGFVQTFEKAGFHFEKMAGTRRHVMTCRL